MSELDPKRRVARSKNLASAYTLSNLIQSEIFIDDTVKLLLNHLNSCADTGSPTNIDKWLSYMSFDIIGEVTFSKRFGFLEQGTDIGDAIANTKALNAYIVPAGFFQTLHNLTLGNPILSKYNLLPMGHIYDTTMRAIRQRSKNQEARFDMIEHWKKTIADHPDRMSMKDLQIAAIGAVGAGSDTVAATLQSFIYHLSRSGKCLEKLQSEIDLARKNGMLTGQVVSFADSQKLPYLQACIKEALRCHGPVPFGLAREAPSEGVSIGDHFFPAKTKLSINPWVIHYSTEIFGADAKTYNPDRWLGAAAPAIEKFWIPQFLPSVDTGISWPIMTEIPESCQHGKQFSGDIVKDIRSDSIVTIWRSQNLDIRSPSILFWLSAKPIESKSPADLYLHSIPMDINDPMDPINNPDIPPFDQGPLNQLPDHLCVPPTPTVPDGPELYNLHFIISTKSGLGHAAPFFYQTVKPLLDSLNVQHYRIWQTSTKDDISWMTGNRFRPQANAGIQQTIVLLSGDGGVVDLINALIPGLDEKAAIPTIAILPFGTGNALAISTNLTKDDTFGLKRLLYGAPQTLPIMRVKFSSGAKLLMPDGTRGALPKDEEGNLNLFGAVVCSWGLHSSLVADSDNPEMRKLGDARFQKAAEELLKEPHPYVGTVSTIASPSFQTFHIPGDEHTYVMATLVSQLSPGFQISPHSEPVDGKLRFIHIGQLPSGEIADLLSRAYFGKHVLDERVAYEEISFMKINIDEKEERWRRVCVDGQIIEVENHGWVTVQREEREVVKLVI
ncbi:MAG: hypothetical protein Q9227_005481 [Pyrenula ochraceoflavens]